LTKERVRERRRKERQSKKRMKEENMFLNGNNI
jgi:hypothetical protein